MKQKHIDMYMEIAEVAAKQSYAERLKVGAVAVRDHRILSIGYNGTPSGTDNQCEDWFTEVGSDGSVTTYSKTNADVIHAEMNLIYKLARDGESGSGSDLFITHAPCYECAKAILSVGFKNVYYRNQYRSEDGINLLLDNFIPVEQK